MFKKPLIKKSLQPILNVEKLQKLVIELDEQKQESISGGAKTSAQAKEPIGGEIAWSIGFADVVRP